MPPPEGSSGVGESAPRAWVGGDQSKKHAENKLQICCFFVACGYFGFSGPTCVRVCGYFGFSGGKNMHHVHILGSRDWTWCTMWIFWVLGACAPERINEPLCALRNTLISSSAFERMCALRNTLISSSAFERMCALRHTLMNRCARSGTH